MDFSDTPLLENRSKIHTYSSITCFAIIINYIAGTGVFGLPSAFYIAGFPLSVLTIVIFLTLSGITAIYVIESLARSNGYTKAQESGEMKAVMGYEVYDYTTMASIWGGKPLKYATSITMMCSAYGSLWAYVATCTSTLCTLFWLLYSNEPMKCDVSNRWQFDWKCNLTYYLSIAFYGAVVIPIAFIELSEQSLLQLALTIYRFLAFGIMFLTCVIQLIVSEPVELTKDVYEDVAFLKTFKWDGFGTMFTHMAFALACQQNLPDALAPLSTKRFAHFITLAGITTCCLIYIAISLVCSWCFTASTPSPVTLAWADYNGREGGWGVGTSTWWAVIIKYTILLFPIINLTNEFPLIVTTLSTNMRSLFPNKESKKVILLSRALAIFPPFILTCLVGSLRVIFDVTGCFSFALCFTFPCIFNFMSRKKVSQKYPGKAKTPYGGVWSRIEITFVILGISLLLFVTAAVFITKELLTSYSII